MTTELEKTPKEFISFSHSGTIGDVIAALPAIKQGVAASGKPAVLYLKNGVEYVQPYKGTVHPTKDESGLMVMLNTNVIEMLIPLIAAQPYIKEVKQYDGEPIDVDLDMIRETYCGIPVFPIQRWYFIVFPQLSCDLSIPWLDIPDGEKDFASGKVIVNRTERYQNTNMNYSFLKEYEDDILFFGTMREYNLFCMQFNLNIRKLHIKNFLELAQAIKQSKFYLGNQSMGFQVAEGMKHNRIVELFSPAPNVTPQGAKGYDFLAQNGLEYYFKKLFNV